MLAAPGLTVIALVEADTGDHEKVAPGAPLSPDKVRVTGAPAHTEVAVAAIETDPKN